MKNKAKLMLICAAAGPMSLAWLAAYLICLTVDAVTSVVAPRAKLDCQEWLHRCVDRFMEGV